MVREFARIALLGLIGLSLVACAGAPPIKTVGGTGRPYQVKGVWYTPKADPNYNEVGMASWYGREHQGKPTADGERFDLAKISGAHKTLPLPSMVEVTNLENGKRIQVRVNDRGPFAPGRIIDLSQAAARELGFEGKGLAKVRVRYLGPGSIRTAELEAHVEE
jgi:rare lipoprotein A